MQEKIAKVRKAKSRLTSRHDREPTLTELAEATGMDPATVQFLTEVMRPCISLDSTLGAHGDLRVLDVVANAKDCGGDPAESVMSAIFREDVARVVEQIQPERSSRIIQRRYGIGTGEPETLERIAADFGVTRERVRQLEKQALTTLETKRDVLALRSYLIDDPKTW